MHLKAVRESPLQAKPRPRLVLVLVLVLVDTGRATCLHQRQTVTAVVMKAAMGRSPAGCLVRQLVTAVGVGGARIQSEGPKSARLRLVSRWMAAVAVVTVQMMQAPVV